jgi:hypothetical protein
MTNDTTNAGSEKKLRKGVKPQIDHPATPQAGIGNAQLKVTLAPTAPVPTDDQGLWVAIRNRSKAIDFAHYSKFINELFCKDGLTNIQSRIQEKAGGVGCLTGNNKGLDARLSIHAADSYNVLRLATEVFLLLECGVVVEEDGERNIEKSFTLLDEDLFVAKEESSRFNEPVTLTDVQNRLADYFGGSSKLPYLRRILTTLLGREETKWAENLPYCDNVLQCRTTCPSMLELIWSYWHEEAMQVQSMNAIAMRFQNRRGPSDRDPLANLEMDPLRPLNNLLWGYIQNEHNRLSISRRAYEYDHHYGITLYGKAVPQLRSADSRSKFLEGFHNLLSQTVKFYLQDSDTTVVADGFPLLNALKEVHLSLAEGAHNQFGDLPWTARVEMLIEQWLLARPEMREFLRGRYMVPYREDWMGTVDTMKKLQNWNDVTVTHFNELAVFGEQILLSIRYGDWSGVNDENQAKNWARYWKPEIQSYIHSYRAVTEVDLTSDPVDSAPPWVHLKRKEQQRGARR